MTGIASRFLAGAHRRIAAPPFCTLVSVPPRTPLGPDCPPPLLLRTGPRNLFFPLRQPHTADTLSRHARCRISRTLTALRPARFSLPVDSKKVAEQWDEGMSRAGFVAVLNHGIDAAVIDSLDKAARTFFAQSQGD